jgi:ABC-type Zn uptake system ZnuABC Zn-binding protein ZnuA
MTSINNRSQWVKRIAPLVIGLLAVALAGCAPAAPPDGERAGMPVVLATETFLADIAQNVAGDRLTVESLIPMGLDPHAFEPTPKDVARIAQSRVFVANGAGFESWLEEILANAGGERIVIEASAGLASRQPDAFHGEEDEHGDADPHFWTDPVNVVSYAENIRDGLIQTDPAGKAVYTANAAAYIAELRALDQWIAEQVAQIPEGRRLLVTNHESLGYFADRYGFEVVGAVMPSFSTGASPSAQQMAQLVEHIRETGAPAIFLETGASAQLANQIAQEAGVKAVTELYTHSLTEAGGPAPSYIEMMRYNVETIVDALK